MRKRLVNIAAAFALTLCVQAEILVYKGAMIEKRAGNGTESRHEYRSLLIIDASTGASKKIDYFPSSSGFYMVQPDQQLSTNKVVLKDGRSQSVFARAQQGGADEPVTALFAKGVNVKLLVANSTYATVPRALDWNLRSAGPSLTGASETLDEVGVLAFHEAFTKTINNRNEGLPEAEQRLRNVLESAGYREVEFK